MEPLATEVRGQVPVSTTAQIYLWHQETLSTKT